MWFSFRGGLVAAALSVALVAVAAPAPGIAQTPDPFFGRVIYSRDDGLVYLLVNAQRHLVEPVVLDEGKLADIPEGQALGDRSLVGLDLPFAPTGAATWIEGRLAVHRPSAKVYLIQGGQRREVETIDLSGEQLATIPQGNGLGEVVFLTVGAAEAIAAMQAPGAAAAAAPPGSAPVTAPGNGSAPMRISGSVAGWRFTNNDWYVVVSVMVTRNGVPVSGAQVSVDFEGDVRTMAETNAMGASNGTFSVSGINRRSIGGVVTACVATECSSFSQYLPAS